EARFAMTAQDLLHDLTMAGVILSTDCERLAVDAPEAVLTDDLIATLKTRKSELLELLASPKPERGAGESPLLATTERIRLYRVRYHPVPVFENIEMHDSAIFDLVVEVGFYDGRRIRIPQQSTPAAWEAPF